MYEPLRCVRNPLARADENAAACFGAGVAERVRAFHRSMPDYRETPLRSLACLAERLGLAALYVKDESPRFGLNAFKALGASWCVARLLAGRAGLDAGSLTFDALRREDARRAAGGMTLVTATDGNHGRGVAWTAKTLGMSAAVFLPRGSAEERLRNILALGAQAEITDMDYDDTVRYAARLAAANGWTLVQDTSWAGYEQIPEWIMQGYTTLALEAAEQCGDEPPTHVLLQAGVGSMAGAVSAFFADRWPGHKPVAVIVEPHGADCLYRTAAAGDGRPRKAEGPLTSMMAGLCCGEPCTVAWQALERFADFFVSMPDAAAARGMRVLGNPLGTDERIISGESGAAGLGCAVELLTNPDLTPVRDAIGLDRDARVLCVSTEGDTDRANYRRVVWDGLLPN